MSPVLYGVADEGKSRQARVLFRSIGAPALRQERPVSHLSIQTHNVEYRNGPCRRTASRYHVEHVQAPCALYMLRMRRFYPFLAQLRVRHSHVRQAEHACDPASHPRMAPPTQYFPGRVSASACTFSPQQSAAAASASSAETAVACSLLTYPGGSSNPTPPGRSTDTGNDSSSAAASSPRSHPSTTDVSTLVRRSAGISCAMHVQRLPCTACRRVSAVVQRVQASDFGVFPGGRRVLTVDGSICARKRWRHCWGMRPGILRPMAVHLPPRTLYQRESSRSSSGVHAALLTSGLRTRIQWTRHCSWVQPGMFFATQTHRVRWY